MIRRHKPELVMCILLILITLTVYWNVQNHDFVNVDDDLYITDNQEVREGLTKEGLIWAFSINEIDYWRPLTWLSHMLDCQLYGLNPQGHHFNNLLLHATNVILLFMTLRYMTGALWRSAAAAAMFALHPLNVESVAWVAERKSVLSTFFWILTLWSYAHYSQKPSLKRYLPVFLFLGLGLMAKPMLVSLPFVLLLLDYWPLARIRLWCLNNESTHSNHRPAPPSRLILEKIPLFVLSGVLTYVSFLSSQGQGMITTVETLPIGLRVQNALLSYVTYILKMVWPADLAVFYPYPENIPFWHYASAGVFLIAVTVWVIRLARRAPYLATGWLWYLGTLVPVIGLFQQGLWPAFADRFVYVPLMGLFIMISWSLASLWEEWRLPTVVFSIAACIAFSSLGIATRLQARHWESSISLFSRAIKVTTNNHLAEFNLASALYKQGNPKKAVSHFSEALRIMPDNAEFRNGLGMTLLELGDIDGSVKHLTMAIGLVPNYAEAHVNLGAALAKAGKLEEAIAHYSRALEIKPMAEAHHSLGLTLAGKGNFHEAVLHYRQALEIKPAAADVHNDLGVALVHQAKMKEALSHFSEALRINPNHNGARQNLRLIRDRLNAPASKLKPTPLGLRN
jgi:Flp pilus assembly protein TadD